MKANEPKRKIFQDAVDLLGGSDAAASAAGGVQMLAVDGIRPFHAHPFHLYEGDRLDDMVESIKEHGVLNPVIVRKMHYGYEMLSGHNRQNAAKLAGLKEIPAIVKEGLSEAEAYVYVIETNLMQRSFTDLQISEKAAVLAERYDKVLYQRQKDEIIAELRKLEVGNVSRDEKGGHCDHLSKNRDNLGQEYGLSGSSVARLLRVNQLIPEIKTMLDAGEMQLLAAVQLSYLPEAGQRLAIKTSKESGIPISKAVAERVRRASMTEKAIREAIAGKDPEVDPVLGKIELPKALKPIRLPAEMRERYFEESNQKEIEETVDKALAAWFKKKR